MGALAGIVFASASQERTPPGRYVNSIGVTLPPGAAPPEEQVFRSFQPDNHFMEWFRTIYKGTYGHTIIAEPLLRLDRDFNLLPAAAERWAPSEDGRTWYFHIRRGLEFSDGHPLTAHDYVFTFRRGADPKNAYDVEWYYRPIKNWAAVVTGKKPLEALGVRALDDYTLAVETETVCAYLPHLLIDSWVSPRQAIEKYGDAWSTRPETSIASGPFYLAEWSKGDRIVLKANSRYHGPAKPYIEALVARLYTLSARPPILAAYEADEVDYADILSQAERGRIVSDPVMRDELHAFTDFATYYLTMNTSAGVFADKRVRQAFSHAIDREALTRSALQGFAVPACSMLPAGFPAANPEALRAFQRYDPALARQRLAEAGYPEGRGFPPVELWVRADSRPVNDAGEAIQAMLRQNLGIAVTMRVMEVKTFMDALNSHRLQLGLVRFGFDYVDPSSLMNLWLSGGRHAWKSDPFDRLVVQAGGVVGDPGRRMALYHQAERILVEEVGGIFLWHSVLNQIWKSKVRGEALEPNRDGYRAWRVDQIGNTSPTIYIARQPQTPRQGAVGFWKRWF
jgi:peptide/nickel transport system substrate-binding protein/oligopeptide transport system substrate-binding protein